MKREKVMRGIKKLFCTVLILSLCFGYAMPVHAASELAGYKLDKYPEFPKVKQKYFIIYSEGYRQNRIEVCFFDITDKKGTPSVSWSGRGVNISNGKMKNDVKYYLDGEKWKKFESGYGRCSDYAKKIYKTNLNVYNYSGKKVVKAVTLKYIKFTNAKMTLGKGDKITLSAKTNISGKVTYKSDKPKIVSVDKKGRITAKKKGTATITATASNGKKATCKVTVK